MKVLCNDGLDKEGLRLFEEAGIETDTNKRNLVELIEDIGGFDGLIVRSATKVTREVIEAGAIGSLEIVGRAGVGYDNIDLEAASEKGITVKYAPHGNTISTAEHALALMLNVSRKIPQAHHSLKNGIWQKKPFKGNELSYKTLGIIGCGRIGQRLSKLVLGFDMDVIGYDPQPNPDSRIKYLSKEEVLAKSDYISIHVNGKDEVIGESELSIMKRNAYLINTARGANVNEDALYNALKAGKILGAALDVYKNEPAEEGAVFKRKLNELENIILCPHIGAQTTEAQTNTSVEIARVVTDYFLGDFSNALNAVESIKAEERPVYRLSIFHNDIPGIFAQIDKVLWEQGINIRENSSRQLGKGGLVRTVYLLHQEVGPDILRFINGIDGVYKAKK